MEWVAVTRGKNRKGKETAMIVSFWVMLGLCIVWAVVLLKAPHVPDIDYTPEQKKHAVNGLLVTISFMFGFLVLVSTNTITPEAFNRMGDGWIKTVFSYFGFIIFFIGCTHALCYWSLIAKFHCALAYLSSVAYMAIGMYLLYVKGWFTAG